MPTARSRAPLSLYGLLLKLWRLAPFPPWLRGLILAWGNTRYPIGVVGLIWDEEGRLLLARHTYLPPPGWGLPGGWLHGEETFEACIARECAEEIGHAVAVGPMVAWILMHQPRHYTLAFECQRLDGAFRPNAEIDAIAFFPLAEAVRLVRPSVGRLIRQAARRRGRPAPGADGAPPPPNPAGSETRPPRAPGD